MACSSASEDFIDIDNLDLEDKLEWLKEILENGREKFATIELNGRLSNLINQLAENKLISGFNKDNLEKLNEEVDIVEEGGWQW